VESLLLWERLVSKNPWIEGMYFLRREKDREVKEISGEDG